MGFDIDDYKQHTRALEYLDLDLPNAFREQRLDEDSLRAIRYMHDVEFHTVCYLRELIVGPAHRDPEVTAFLGFWNFEEYWHGEALSEVLAAHGEPNNRDRIEVTRAHPKLADRLGPFTTLAGAALFGDDFTAIHMTWGAINEWVAQAGYAQLARKADHPVLTELLQRIMKQEGRHIDFYKTQAEKRLERSRKARAITRWTVKRFWEPVGSTLMPRLETDFLAMHLFADSQGKAMAERIDRRVDKLPGLAGLGLLDRALDRSESRWYGEHRQPRRVGLDLPTPAPQLASA